MKKVKKFGFVAPILIILLLVAITTCFVEGRSGITYLAIGDMLINYIQSYYYFFDTIIYIFVIGGLYGALNKVPQYKKLVRLVSQKMEGKRRLFVIISTIVFVLLTAVGGFNLLSLIFIPFVISVIILLGYDKLIALSSTVLATFVGIIGGVFLNFRDGTNQYASSFTTFDKIAGLNGHFETIIFRIVLLVISTLLLVFFIVRYIRKYDNGEGEGQLSLNDVFNVDTKINVDDYKVWPFVLMSCILFIVLVLGFMPWNDLFGIKCFDDFHTWITGLKIGNYAVFTNLISKNFVAFGRWGDLGNFMMAVICIFIFLFILKFVSGVKFKELKNGFIYGVKKMIPGVMVLALAFSVLVAVYNSGFIETVINNFADSYSDNAFIGAIISIFGTILNVDLFYVVAGVFSPLVSSLTDKANLNVYAVLFQSIYGLVQIFGPTSILLIVSLSYLDVPYSKWLKYIWRFVLSLFIVIFIILMIITLI